MVIVEGSPELTFGIRHHIRTRPAGWTDGADAGAAGTTVPISGARSMNETMSPRSGTASIPVKKKMNTNPNPGGAGS